MLHIAIFMLLFNISECCEHLFVRWKLAYCQRSVFDLCYGDGQMTLDIAAEFRKVVYNCHGNFIDTELIVCLKITNILVLEIIGCEYYQLEFSDLVPQIPTEKIILDQVAKSWTPSDNIFCDNIIGLKKFSIKRFFKYNSTFERIFGNNLKTLAIVEVTEHGFVKLSQAPFLHLTLLKKLIFQRGELSKLRPDDFTGLGSLKTLDLSWNKIEQLETDVFKELTLLQELRLVGNQIASLSEQHLQYLPNLTILRVDIPDIQYDLLKHSLSLRDFEIHSTGIKELPRGLFQGVSSLRALNASSCGLSLNEKTTLVSHSRETYPQNLVQPQSSPKDSLSWLGYALKDLHSLQTLDLSRNGIAAIRRGTFDSLNRLEEIYLSHNPLTHLPSYLPFGPTKFLRIIEAKNCQIELPPDFNFLRQFFVDVVDLSHNRIKSVSLPLSSNRGTVVFLNDNSIKTIRIDRRLAKCLSNRTAFYYLENNAISCDCYSLEFIRYIQREDRKGRIFAHGRELECSESLNKVSAVDAKEMNCAIQCFLPCVCTIKSMNCSGAHLTEVPPTIPRGVKALDLSNNKIETLSNTDRRYWESTKELYLSNNYLVLLKGWQFPLSLTVLALDGNKLSSLPSKIMEFVNSTENISLYLARNNWKCDCESLQMKQWFMDNVEKIKDAEDVRCSLHYYGTSVDAQFANIPKEHFCVDSSSAVVVVSVVLVTCFLAVAALLSYFRFTILSLLYSRNWIAPLMSYKGMETTYDAFLCYVAADQEVADQIIEELEPVYSICSPDRDWPSRCGYHKNTIRSIMKSRSTLLLVSGASLQCPLFRVKFRCAHNMMVQDKTHRVIAITIGSFNTDRATDDELRKFIASQPSIKWGEKWFWQKLKYSLSYKR